MILFREVQRWRDVRRLMALIIGLAVFQWWIFYAQIVRGIPAGDNPGSDGLVLVLWLACGVGLPLFFLWFHMLVVVTPDEVRVRYRPFADRGIAIDEITRVEPRVFRPLADFGGWGIRGWGGRIAYNVSGNTGVELTLADGRRVLIGSQRAAELAGAIYKAGAVRAAG